MIAVSFVDYTWPKHHGQTVLWGSVFLVVLVLVPGTGMVHNNAQRQISLFGLLAFQPSETVKLGVILDFSYIILRKRNWMGKWQYGILPFRMSNPALPCGSFRSSMLRRWR